MNVSICRLPIYKAEASSNLIRVQTEWSGDGFRITLLDNGSVWVGKASSCDLIATSQALSMEFEDYMRETRTALTTQGGANEFVYAIEDDKFLWKKFVDSSQHIKNKFGSVTIEEVPATEMIEYMLDTIIDINSCMQARAGCLEQENGNLHRENEGLKTKLSTYKDEKNTMEGLLYSKFIEILNSKKLRIGLLEEKIASLKNSPSTSSDSRAVPSVNKKSNIGKSTKIQPPTKRKKIDKIVEDKSNPPPRNLRKNIVQKSSKTSMQMSVTPSTSCVDNFAQGSSAITTSCFNKSDFQNHYDSETDCDSSNEDEFKAGPITTATKTSGLTFDNEIYDDGDIPVSDLSNSVQQVVLNVHEVCDTSSVSTLPVVAKDSALTRETEREINTQQFLDELGI